MRHFKIITLIICSILGLFTLAAFIAGNTLPAKSKVMNADEKGFAVLELFTSEGCSSCPPADELLAKIQKELDGKGIYVLVYHVDYWDRLGWKDMFSNADYSKRQIQYVKWLRTSSVYTPQVIVNGRAEFVGSNESAIRGAISAQLALKPKAALKFQVRQENEKRVVQYQATNALKNDNLLIAVIQRKAETKVERGENAGRILDHVQIVRQLNSERLNASGQGSIYIDLPKGFDINNGEILGLIQDQNTGEISAVAKAGLDNPHHD
jgi:hypothetical protein